MKDHQLRKWGIPGRLAKLAKWQARAARAAGLTSADIRLRLMHLVADPASHRDDPYFGQIAAAMAQGRQIDAAAVRGWTERKALAPWRSWGEELDEKSVDQLKNACRLPISVHGALMPDAHVGYGLPIGGVLATDNAVIPYAVGVDIACRVKLTVLDLPPSLLDEDPRRLARAIESETRFGVGAHFGDRARKKRQHDVLDENWSVTPVTAGLKDKAHEQLGTSGSGNHFVEFGLFEPIDDEHARALNLEKRPYLALMTHSGSRGAGAQIAGHYSKLAMRLHPELPQELKHLAWLDLDSEEGRDYWNAMQLMGKYAHANHDVIHREILRYLGAQALFQVENHHNFAWREQHPEVNEGRAVIVHRKGATPAGEGVLGVIPGSMASPAYVVRGKGSSESLRSAAHGAGRVMSRTQARKNYRWPQVNAMLKERNVTLLSAGLDEVPMVYKNIDTVMNQQQDLVEKVARFDPRLVKMAPAGERPED